MPGRVVLMQPHSVTVTSPCKCRVIKNQNMSPMKNNTSSKSRKSKVDTSVRYDEAQRKAICAYMKTHTNADTKRKFGCSAHWCGALRREAKIKLVDFTPSTKGKSLL